MVRFWNERHCKICGKEFYPTTDHIYKENGEYYGCWTCFNRREKKKAPRWSTKTIEVYNLEGELLETFTSVEKAADYVGGIGNNIRAACKKAEMSPDKLWGYKVYLWRYADDLS